MSRPNDDSRAKSLGLLATSDLDVVMTSEPAVPPPQVREVEHPTFDLTQVTR